MSTAAAAAASIPVRPWSFYDSPIAMQLSLEERWDHGPLPEDDDKDGYPLPDGEADIKVGTKVNRSLICRYIKKDAVGKDSLAPSDACSVVVTLSLPVPIPEDYEFNDDNYEKLAGRRFKEWEKLNSDFKPLGNGERARCRRGVSRTPDTYAIRIGDDPRGPALAGELERMVRLLDPERDHKDTLAIHIQETMMECGKKCGVGSHSLESCGAHAKILAKCQKYNLFPPRHAVTCVACVKCKKQAPRAITFNNNGLCIQCLVDKAKVTPAVAASAAAATTKTNKRPRDDDEEGVSTCDGETCWEQDDDGEYRKSKTHCDGCVLYKCPTCAERMPKWVMDCNEGHCMNCAVDAYAKKTKKQTIAVAAKKQKIAPKPLTDKQLLENALEACTHIFTMGGDIEEAMEECDGELHGTREGDHDSAWTFAKAMYAHAEKEAPKFLAKFKKDTQ